MSPSARFVVVSVAMAQGACALTLRAHLDGDPNVTTGTNECECRNWKEIYASGAVPDQNPAGFEFYGPVYEGVRDTLLDKVDGSFCIRQQMESDNENMWCYVSPTCAVAKHDGGGITPTLGVKLCKKSDPTLPATTGREFREYAHQYSIRASGGWMNLARLTLSKRDFEKFFAENCEPDASAHPYTKCAEGAGRDQNPPIEPRSEFPVIFDESDECKCLNWKDLYASNAVSCHDPVGYEYYTEELNMNLTGKQADEADDERRCTNYLEKYDGNFCINQQVEADNDKMWCYVSPKCPEAKLNGGRLTPTFKNSTELIGVKICTAEGPRIPASTGDEFRELAYNWDIYSNGDFMNLAKFTLTKNEFGVFFLQNCERGEGTSFYTACTGGEGGEGGR